MTKELTDITSKDIDNIYVPAIGCVNNAPHSKVVPSRHVHDAEVVFSKHTLPCCRMGEIAEITEIQKD